MFVEFPDDVPDELDVVLFVLVELFEVEFVEVPELEPLEFAEPL